MNSGKKYYYLRDIIQHNSYACDLWNVGEGASGVTTGPADPASGGAAPLGGGILKICWKNWQFNVRFNDGRQTKKLYRSIKPSDLATADGQKNYRGRQKSAGGGKKKWWAKWVAYGVKFLWLSNLDWYGMSLVKQMHKY